MNSFLPLKNPIASDLPSHNPAILWTVFFFFSLMSKSVRFFSLSFYFFALIVIACLHIESCIFVLIQLCPSRYGREKRDPKTLTSMYTCISVYPVVWSYPFWGRRLIRITHGCLGSDC